MKPDATVTWVQRCFRSVEGPVHQAQLLILRSGAGNAPGKSPGEGKISKTRSTGEVSYTELI